MVKPYIIKRQNPISRRSDLVSNTCSSIAKANSSWKKILEPAQKLISCLGPKADQSVGP